jgi:hypothetical protein
VVFHDYIKKVRFLEKSSFLIPLTFKNNFLKKYLFLENIKNNNIKIEFESYTKNKDTQIIE